MKCYVKVILLSRCSFYFLLELIFKYIPTILNSIEISQGGSNTDSGPKRGLQYRYTTICN